MKAFVVFVILRHVSQHALGVEVNEGVESVLLPCEGPWFHRVTKVVWSRVGSNPSTVHQHEDNQESYLQNQHYSGRTSMSADALMTKDFSLTLRKPKVSDSGQYTCTYSDIHGKTEQSIPLHVLDLFTRWLRLVVILFVVLVVVLVVVVALCLYIWFQTISVSRVEVKEGEWFVKLPFQTTLLLPQDATVEWSRCAPEPMKVHEYRNGGSYLVKQDEFYCNRTKMEIWPLKTQDLSLTLRNPCFRDSGSYICTVHKDREIWTQKVVRLRVKAIQKVVVVGKWAPTVKLPFKTTAQLPGDATVEWRRSDTTKVHVFKNGEDQPEDQYFSYRGRTKMKETPLQTGNLSLILIEPTDIDVGTYICTVCSDGDVLWSRIVQLKVKERGWFWF